MLRSSPSPRAHVGDSVTTPLAYAYAFARQARRRGWAISGVIDGDPAAGLLVAIATHTAVRVPDKVSAAADGLRAAAPAQAAADRELLSSATGAVAS